MHRKSSRKARLQANQPKRVSAVRELTREELDNLILSHRDSARALARTLLRAWSVRLDPCEVDSTVDLALCEAARGFKPDAGTKFMTYLYYFLKGSLIETLTQNMRFRREIIESERTMPEGQNDYTERADVDQNGIYFAISECPERHVYRRQLRARMETAMLRLSNLEKKVVVNVHVMELKLARVARDLGYSRGYINDVRGSAFKKMRQDLEELDEAA